MNYHLTIILRWYGALSNIDVGKSILKSKYIHWFRIFKFNNILLKKMFQNNFGNLKMIKASPGFKLVTYRFIGNVLTRCTTLLNNNYFWKDVFFFLIDFIVYLNRKYVATNLHKYQKSHCNSYSINIPYYWS